MRRGGVLRWAAGLALEGLVFTIPWQGAVTVGAVGRLSRLVGLVALAVAALALLVDRPRRAPAAVHWLLAAHVAVATASWFWSLRPDATGAHALTMVQLLAMTLLLWEFGARRAQRVRFLVAWVAGCWTAAALTWQSYLTGTEAGGGGYQDRYSIGNANVNDVGLLLALGIPVAWYVAGQVRAPWLRLACRLYPAGGLLGIAATSSRASLLAAGVGLLVVPASMRQLTPLARVWTAAWVPALLAGVVLVLAPQASIDRLSTTADEVRSGDLNERRQLWAAGLDAFADHPLGGVGGGASRHAIAERTGREAGAHNTFISIAAEVGVLGLVPFGLALVVVGGVLLRLPFAERRAGLVLLATLLLGLVPLHWERSKGLWFVVAVLAMGLAVPEPAVVRPRARLVPVPVLTAPRVAEPAGADR